MGLGFTLGLVILGGVRELIGTGSLLGFQLLPEPISFPILSYPAGAFLTMGLIIAIFNAYRLKIKVVK